MMNSMIVKNMPVRLNWLSAVLVLLVVMCPTLVLLSSVVFLVTSIRSGRLSRNGPLLMKGETGLALGRANY